MNKVAPIGLFLALGLALPAAAQQPYSGSSVPPPVAQAYLGQQASIPVPPQVVATSIAGTYSSNNFYPNPLQLTITAVDANGNVAGTLWGMAMYGPDKHWERWSWTFGTSLARLVPQVDEHGNRYRTGVAVAQFQNGTLTLKFPVPHSYTLRVVPGGFEGMFNAPAPYGDKRITFSQAASS